MPEENSSTINFWYWVWISQITIQKSSVTSEVKKGEVWNNLIILKGNDARAVVEKAERIGRQSEGDVRGSLTLDSEPAICLFLGVQDFGLVDGELKDGTEILYEVKRQNIAQAKNSVLDGKAIEKRIFELNKIISSKIGN